VPKRLDFAGQELLSDLPRTHKLRRAALTVILII